jgi:hypothetical protein
VTLMHMGISLFHVFDFHVFELQSPIAEETKTFTLLGCNACFFWTCLTLLPSSLSATLYLLDLLPVHDHSLAYSFWI